MNKNIVLVVFPTIYRAQHFFEEIVKPLSNIIRHDKSQAVTDKYIFKFHSEFCPDKMRGYSPEWIYMSNDLDMEAYKVLLQLVKGDHNKIKVVD